MATVASFFGSGTSYGIHCSAYQTFTSLIDGVLTSVKIRAAQGAAAAYTEAKFSLYTVNEDHVPVEAICTLGTLTNADLSTSYEWKTFDYFGGAWVDAGAEYAILCVIWGDQICAAGDSSDSHILLESGSGYAGGISQAKQCSNTGGGWACEAAWSPTIYDWAMLLEGTEWGLPSQASDPTPTDGAVAGETDWSTPTLSWTGDGDTYDVYIGTTDIFIASDRVAEGIADTTYTLTAGQKAAFADLSDGVTNLYWRVDSTNDEGTTEGDTWTFDPRPGQPTLDVPANGSTVQLTQPLSWEFGTYADTVDVFIKPDDTLEITQLATDTTDTIYEWDDDFLAWGTGYTWQVVCKNYYGETEGPDWTFTAATLDHPRVTYHLLDDGSGAGPYDTPAGEEGVDYVWTGENCMATTKRLVLAAASKFWYEDRA